MTNTAFSQKNEVDSVRKVLKELMLESTYPADTNYINALNQYAYLQWSTSPDSVLLLSNQGLSLSEKINFRKGKLRALTNIGTGYFAKGDYAKALTVENEAVELAQELNNWDALAVLYINMSQVYIALGNYPEALDVTLKGLAISEKYNFEKRIARNNYTIGQIYQLQNRLDDALNSFVKSKALFEAGGFNSVANIVAISIGDVYAAQKRYPEALQAYNESLKISRENNLKSAVCSALGSIGTVLLETGKPKEALVYYEEALANAQQRRHKADEARLMNNIAKSYEELNKPAQALPYANEALQLAIEIGNKGIIRNSHLTLSDVYNQLANYKISLEHYRQFKLYSDSLLNSETEQKLIQLEEKARYDREQLVIEKEHAEEVAEQRAWIYIIGVALVAITVVTIILIINIRNKQRVNRVLRQTRDRINQQKEKLEEMSVFKDRLLSVVAHDVRGPLNSLRGSFELFNLKVFSPQELIDLLTKLGGKISQVNGFVDDLLLWAKSQMTEAEVKISRFELNKAIEKTVALLKPEAEAKKIEIRCALQSIHVDADEEMIKIVVRNLISNAIKFCHAGDTIDVANAINTTTNHVTVSIIDTGVGISFEKLSQLFMSPHLSSQGTSYEVGTGLGLMLSKQYMEANRGTIGVEPNGNRGSKFWFTLPLNG